ncbi:unnamed protein product, partial [Ilex paraguariensis]
VFKKFKDDEGKFKESLNTNVQGLLSLYEATQLRVHGEESASEGANWYYKMKKLIRAYFPEAKWFNEGYVPTTEEYMEVALVSCGYMMLSTTSFVGMGELATKEHEQERGHEALAVECYMKQHGASKQEAYAEFGKQVTNAWKDINQECLHPTAVPMPFLMRVLNLACFMNPLYKDGYGYTNSKTKCKTYVTSLLVDSVPK